MKVSFYNPDITERKIASIFKYEIYTDEHFEKVFNQILKYHKKIKKDLGVVFVNDYWANFISKKFGLMFQNGKDVDSFSFYTQSGKISFIRMKSSELKNQNDVLNIPWEIFTYHNDGIFLNKDCLLENSTKSFLIKS